MLLPSRPNADALTDDGESEMEPVIRSRENPQTRQQRSRAASRLRLAKYSWREQGEAELADFNGDEIRGMLTNHPRWKGLSKEFGLASANMKKADMIAALLMCEDLEPAFDYLFCTGKVSVYQPLPRPVADPAAMLDRIVALFAEEARA